MATEIRKLFGCALAAAAVLWAGAQFTGCGSEPKAPDGPQDVSFQAPAGTPLGEIASAGDLKVSAGCQEIRGDPSLIVTAETSAASATITSRFRSQAAGRSYRFTLDEFGSEYGAWDFLGSGNGTVTGALEYWSESTGRVTLDYSAGAGPARGCRFKGTLWHAG